MVGVLPECRENPGYRRPTPIQMGGSDEEVPLPTPKANVRGLSSLIPNLCKVGDLGGGAQPNESQALELESLLTSGFY